MERTGTILTACNVAHRPPLVVRPATLSDTRTRAQESGDSTAVQPYSRERPLSPVAAARRGASAPFQNVDVVVTLVERHDSGLVVGRTLP